MSGVPRVIFASSSGSALLCHSWRDGWMDGWVDGVLFVNFWCFHALAFPQKRRGKQIVSPVGGIQPIYLRLNDIYCWRGIPPLWAERRRLAAKRSIAKTTPSAITFSSRIYTSKKCAHDVVGFFHRRAGLMLCVTFLSLQLMMICPRDDSGR